MCLVVIFFHSIMAVYLAEIQHISFPEFKPENAVKNFILCFLNYQSRCFLVYKLAIFSKHNITAENVEIFLMLNVYYKSKFTANETHCFLVFYR